MLPSEDALWVGKEMQRPTEVLDAAARELTAN
jgi:hypothetical protein